MTRLKNTLLITVLLVATVTLPAQSAVAQEDSSIWDGFTSDDKEDAAGGLACFIPGDEVTFADCNRDVFEGVSATVDRGQYLGSRALSFDSDEDDREQADEYATDLEKTYNSNADEIEEYVNGRFSGNASEFNVIRLDFAVNDGEATRYLVADVKNDTFENSSVVEETDRPVDYTVSVQDFAADQASDELDRFVTEYVDEDRDIDRSLIVRMGNRYVDNIDVPEGLLP